MAACAILGRVPARTVLIALAATAAFAGACGGDDEATSGAPPPPDATAGANPEDVAVIAAWADTLRSGDVEGAAEYFALPSIAENGVTFELETPEQAEAFNASLPCGARLIEAVTEGDFTTATFRLTERPGPGTCGDGTGNTAQTSFVIEDGKIAEWRRVGLPGERSPGQST